MSDATLIRALAGAPVRRADTLRDERGVPRSHKVEEFLVGLPGWLPPVRERARGIVNLAEQVTVVGKRLAAAS